MIEKNHRRKMPELDFIKVKRKIRSVPASPKHSPTTNKTKWSRKNGGFYKNLRKKSADAGTPTASAIASIVKNCISSPNTPLNGSRNDLTKFNDEIFDDDLHSSGTSNVKNSKKVHLNVQSFSDDELQEKFGQKNKNCSNKLVARRRSEAGEICRRSISRSRVCVILNDEELLLVSENFSDITYKVEVFF